MSQIHTDEDRLDAAAAAYLEAVEAGNAADRARLVAEYPALAEFFADADAVGRRLGPLREALRGEYPGEPTVPFDPDRTNHSPAQAGSPPVRTFGRYELLGELGRGGMGVVYKARDTQVGRLVALKVILAGDHAGPELEKRFLTEARNVARLQHPGVVQLHDFGREQGRLYLTLEFVEGGTLASRLKGALPSADVTAALIEQLARAVHAAHQRSIVHRDLKPANVLLTAAGVPKVADFGLAKCLDDDGDHTASGAILGTSSYMAPEQAAGHGKRAEPRTDVYALGAILYECLTGQPPFRGASMGETLRQVEFEPPELPRNLNPLVDRALEAICLKCLKKDPADRFPSAEALADHLDAWRQGARVDIYAGAAPWLIREVLRESRYIEVMQRWGKAWQVTAGVYLVLCLAKSLLLWEGVAWHGAYFLLWLAAAAAMAATVWGCRLRQGPRLSHVEQQMMQLFAIFWAGFFLTAWQYAQTGGPPAGLLPILVLEAAVAFACMATILGGSFYVMALACLATAALEALWPQVGPLISAAVCSPALFWLGWKHARRAGPAPPPAGA